MLAMALVMPAAQAAAPPASASDSCTALSANLLHAMRNGHFSAATAHFDKTMKALLSPQRIKQAWQQQLPAIFGAFKNAEMPQEIHKGGNSIVITPLRFANGWGKMLVACNTQNQIAGWRILPGKAPNAATSQAPTGATVWIAEAAVGAKTLPITVERDGFALRGVLDLPAGRGPFPVVDLIPGSGPVNINGNDHAGPGGGIAYSPYKKLAAALVKASWAVVRIAKRGMPPSTGNGNDVVFADQVDDNVAIVEALRKNPHINSREIVVAGHSIGGLIAPKLATETPLAGLILLEAPGESMTKITITQAIESAKKEVASARKIIALKDHLKQLYSRVVKAPPGQTVSLGKKQTIFSKSASLVQLYKSWFAQKPLATARKVKIPALVVQGGMDFNIPPGNGKRLVRALPYGKLLYLPKMGHALDIAPCRCMKQLDTGKHAKLAPGLAAGIIHWLQSLEVGNGS